MKLEIIILAAGQGTRMRSSLPKVLHPIAGRPMLSHVIDTARELQPVGLHVVVGHGAEAVQQAIAGDDIHWVHQQQQLGTGHAVMQALPAVSADSCIVVMYGDVPLIEAATLSALAQAAVNGPAVLTAKIADPTGYGRVLRDATGKLSAVVEHKDASEEQRAVDEINTGVMAGPAKDFNAYLPRVGNDNSQGEYYLPDVLAMSVADGRDVASCVVESEIEVLGINDRLQQQMVEREYQRRQAQALLQAGVAIADASRIDIRGELVCGNDVHIDVNAVFEGRVELGNGVHVGPNCVIKDSRIADGVEIHAFSSVDGATVGTGCSVGPYARLRPGTELGEGARIGNFVETKKARIGSGSKANHLAYIGDCEMGAQVNIGAGTITCNYDGVNKHKTTIGNDVFVGSNSTLVAPLEIADQGFVAAGSTVTKRVGDKELAVSRARQRNVQGWRRPQKDED